MASSWLLLLLADDANITRFPDTAMRLKTLVVLVVLVLSLGQIHLVLRGRKGLGPHLRGVRMRRGIRGVELLGIRLGWVGSEWEAFFVYTPQEMES